MFLSCLQRASAPAVPQTGIKDVMTIQFRGLTLAFEAIQNTADLLFGGELAKNVLDRGFSVSDMLISILLYSV